MNLSIDEKDYFQFFNVNTKEINMIIPLVILLYLLRMLVGDFFFGLFNYIIL